MTRALLLFLLLAGCGYVFDATTGERVPDPEFRLIRLAGGESIYADFRDLALTVRIDRDGRISMKGMEYPVPETLTRQRAWRLTEEFWKISETDRDMEHPTQPSQVRFDIVADARVGWERVRPVILGACHFDVRMPKGALLGIRGDELVAWRAAFMAPNWNRFRGEWETWNGDEVLLEVILTPAARDGIDAAALGARVTEGPVLLWAADGVPAQVVADALCALNAAGATPVLLCPDAPPAGGEEALPGIVIR